MVVINHSKKGMKANHSMMATTATRTVTTLPSPTYSHEVGKDLIPELAMRVYSSYLDSFREAISNAFDENSERVSLSISSDKIVIEDWGNGIKDYNEFRKFGQASKKSRKGEVIGEKGLGKLSLLNLGRVVCFETNNGIQGMKFYMTLDGFSIPTYKEKTTAFVSHKGTKITITKLVNVIQIDELRAYLKRTFGLRLAQGAKLIINHESIKPGYSPEPTEHFLFNLTKSRNDIENATKVTGNLRATEEGKGIVDLYIDHVFVNRLEVDTRRKFDGWVNCNALTPETSRNNIVQNGIYREFIHLLRRYTSRFPLREISIDEHKLMLNRELNSLLRNYLKDMRINIHSRSHINIHENTTASKSATFQRYREETDNSALEDPKGTLGIVQNQSDVSSSSPTNLLSVKGQKQQRREHHTPNNISVVWEFADLGNEKEPIYFVPPNIIYCNTSNDLYKFAMQKNRHYGPTWIRILPYLARIAVAMGSGSISRLSPEQFNARIDEATRYFLKQKKVI